MKKVKSKKGLIIGGIILAGVLLLFAKGDKTPKEIAIEAASKAKTAFAAYQQAVANHAANAIDLQFAYNNAVQSAGKAALAAGGTFNRSTNEFVPK